MPSPVPQSGPGDPQEAAGTRHRKRGHQPESTEKSRRKKLKAQEIECTGIKKQEPNAQSTREKVNDVLRPRLFHITGERVIDGDDVYTWRN